MQEVLDALAQPQLCSSPIITLALSQALPPQGDLRAGAVPGAQEVLDALAAACGRGAGRPLATWAAASFRAAGALGLAPADAAALGPRQCLRLLLMRGPAAAPVRPSPCAPHGSTTRGTWLWISQPSLCTCCGVALSAEHEMKFS